MSLFSWPLDLIGGRIKRLDEQWEMYFVMRRRLFFSHSSDKKLTYTIILFILLEVTLFWNHYRRPIRIDNQMNRIFAVNLSILITFIFHIVLNEKRVRNSLSQDFIENMLYDPFLSSSCILNQRGMYCCKIFFFSYSKLTKSS